MQTRNITPVEQRVRALDVAVPLLPLAKLDVRPDGRITTSDAAAFERVADRTRRDAAGADAETGAKLLEYASQLDYAGQQARYGAAMLEDGRVPAPAATANNIVPTSALPRGSTPSDVIDAIAAVDTGRLRAAGVRPVATFDVDGTSIKGDIYLPFTELMAREGRFTPRANDVFRAALAKVDVDQDVVARNGANENALLLLDKIDPLAREDTPTAISNATGFFALGDAIVGQEVADLQGIAKRLMEKGVGATPPYREHLNDDSPAAGDSVRDVVRALKANDIEPHIVTWGFDFIARVAAPHMGIDPEHVIGTHAIVDDRGIITGHDARTVASKDVMVRRQTGTIPLFAFGDTCTDLAMLDLAAARGVVVNPTSRMRSAIEERDGRLGQVRYSSTVGETSQPQG